ncbi:MAG TPA: hypothetical protein VK963_03560 [Candidatus Saccharimonadales bacterium]|nr:hypothetical protein [Candidatus Saccharimonadales bacterium]
MKTSHPGDQPRAEYLQLCEDLISHIQAMRNYAMKPGNAWLAKAELAKINSLVGEAELMLEQIKRADTA